MEAPTPAPIMQLDGRQGSVLRLLEDRVELTSKRFGGREFGSILIEDAVGCHFVGGASKWIVFAVGLGLLGTSVLFSYLWWILAVPIAIFGSLLAAASMAMKADRFCISSAGSEIAFRPTRGSTG